MTIIFRCECGQELKAKEEHAGQRTRCPACQRELIIPAASEAVQPSPTPAPARPEAVIADQPRRPTIEERRDDDEEAGLRRGGPTRTSTKAIISLVFGILANLGCTIFAGIPAIILGILGLGDIRRGQGRVGGQGMAIAGIILGSVSVVCVPVMIGLLVPAVQKVREAAGRIKSQNNLKQLGLAMDNFNAQTGQLPPAVVYDDKGNPLYSWRVLLLPYIEEEALYHDFHLDEPWDSPHNKALLARMPKTYQAPDEGPPKEPYATYYQVFDGPGAAFDSDKKELKPFDLGGVPAGQSLRQGANISHFPGTFTDGTSNTILIAEANEPVPWTKPADLHWDPKGPLPKLGRDSNRYILVLLADGSVRTLSRSISPATLRAAITVNGGETLGPDW